jgi:hypothetical protein
MRVPLIAVAVLVGRAHPTHNDGDKVVLQYTPGFADRASLQAKADSACVASGKAGAAFKADVSMHPETDWLAPDRLATFECK